MKMLYGSCDFDVVFVLFFRRKGVLKIGARFTDRVLYIYLIALAVDPFLRPCY